MSLPRIGPRWETLTVGGEEVKIRCLTGDESFDVKDRLEAGDLRGANQLAVAYGTDTPLEDVKAWWAATASEVVESIANAVARLSVFEEADAAEVSKSV